MTEKAVTPKDRQLYGMMVGRGRQLRAQGVLHPNLMSMEEFTSQAAALGWESSKELWGAVTAEGRRAAKASPRKPLATFKDYSDSKTIHKEAMTAIARYRALIRNDGDFIMEDEQLARVLGCRVVTVARIRSKLKEEGYSYKKVPNGYVWSLPKKIQIVTVPPATNGIGAQTSTVLALDSTQSQLPLPAPTVEPVATTVTGTLQIAPELALVVTESDLEVVVKKLAHIETLLEQLVSENRQQRGIFAQLLQKWS